LASGSVIQPGETATGQVLLLNLTDKAVFVPAKTILLTSLVPSVSFLTEKSIEVPVGNGKTVNVPIRAALSGPDGNVEPGTVTLFDGALGSQLSVINRAPISGGTLVTVAMATDQDRENLRKRLLADLQRQALTVFAGQVSEGDILFPATITRLRVIEESFIPATEKAGEKISLTMRVEYRISFVANSDLRLLGELVSDASIPAGSLAASDQIDLTPVSGYQEGQGIVRWQMRVERNLQTQVDANQVVSLVQGKTRGEASQNLTRVFDLELQPRIEIHPVWWPWLPFLPVRIVVKG